MRILKELDFPPVFLISTEQFAHVEGAALESDFGIASTRYPVIAVRKSLRGRVKENVLFHEVFHHIFPSKPHWWIEAAAERCARGGGRGYYCTKYGRSVEDVPSRSRIMELARRASRRLKS